jgi:protein-arginine kinase activator protein McsA
MSKLACCDMCHLPCDNLWYGQITNKNGKMTEFWICEECSEKLLPESKSGLISLPKTEPNKD